MCGHKQCPLKWGVMTQLAPAGALPLVFLGSVGSVQPELVNSYNPAALQGQLRGHPCMWLAAPSAWLLCHPADPELGPRASCHWGRAHPQPGLCPCSLSIAACGSSRMSARKQKNEWINTVSGLAHAKEHTPLPHEVSRQQLLQRPYPSHKKSLPFLGKSGNHFGQSHEVMMWLLTSLRMANFWV